ncbi:MAG: FeoB-associated Cys-rich membrane protein [Lachnospiraceae bacterium]|nr:FeoB-associated Cys-rich membrane protein [Lachnospiraceae bacterium]
MIAWITDNIANIVIVIILLTVIGLAVWSIIRNRKKGRSCCGGSCGGCMYSGSCKDNKRE